jgi:hypothetical protein
MTCRQGVIAGGCLRLEAQQQVRAIIDVGREAIGTLRLRALLEIVIRSDIFDVVMVRRDSDHLDCGTKLPGVKNVPLGCQG